MKPFDTEFEHRGKDVEYVNAEAGYPDVKLIDTDDDGRHPRRDASWQTAFAHIVTAVIGSGILSLGWAIAQMGWVFGPITLFIFSGVTYHCAALLALAYRTNNNPNGRRNYTYMMAVKAHLGLGNQILCAVIQYANLYATGVGYTVTASQSFVAARRAICFHNNDYDKEAPCDMYNIPWMLMFGGLQIGFSQIPNFGGLWWLSYLATLMSFAYGLIGFGLAIGKTTEKGHADYGTVFGVAADSTPAAATWNIFVALGSMAFAYSFNFILIEVQDTLKETNPRSEDREMIKATRWGIGVTTAFYMAVGTLSYAGFGNASPGNLLTGFGYFKPYWLVSAANIFVWIHLLGAYQVFMQPFMVFVEDNAIKLIPTLGWQRNINIPVYGVYPWNPFKMASRSLIVCTTTLVACVLPFFNDLVGFLGSIGFWPLTVHLPIEMYIKMKGIHWRSPQGIAYRLLSGICLLITLASAIGSIEYVVQDLQDYTVFKSYSSGTADN